MEELEGLLETGGVLAVEIAASAMAERGAEPRTCPNCGKPLIGPFCALCGQPHNTHRRSLGHLLHDFFKDIVSFDSRILRTARALLVRPGELPNAFRHGRTQPYVPAVRLYLFVSLLFFLFLSATGIAFVQLGLQVQSERLTHDKAGHVIKTVNGKSTILPGLKSDAKGNVTRIDPRRTDIKLPEDKADGHTINNNVTTKAVFFERIGHSNIKMSADARLALEQIQKEAHEDKATSSWMDRGAYATLARLEKDPAALNGPLTTWIPRILFVLLPLFAVLLALFYVRQRKQFLFVDHLVFSLTMHSFAFVVLIGAAAAAQLITSGWLVVATWALLSVYLFLSLKYFYGQGWLITSLKFAGITTTYAVFFLGPALGFALAASVLGGD
jgi:hypothetical protein